jgi:enoyl-CoA hydratase/carnithine racemase
VQLSDVVWSPADLEAAAVEPNWAERAAYLVVDVRGGISAALARWLATQPIPIVAVGSTLSPAVDLAVEPHEVERLVRAIEKNPAACAVLVQVLRVVGRLPVEDALAVESMAYATLQSGREFAAWRASRAVRTKPRREEDIVLLRRDGDRVHLVLNSPETRNALSVPMRDALTEAFKLVAIDPDIVEVHVSANGPCFSSGGDLDEFGTANDYAEAHRIRMLGMPARYLAAQVGRYRFHVHGACIGAGIELPAFAGRLTASSDAFFQLPEVAMGLIPGAGGCVSIPRRIGRQRTAYMAILGERFPAERALAWGLIDAIEN